MPPVATYPSTGGRGEIQRCVFQKKENARESPPTFIRGKRYKTQKKGLRTLRIRVQELFTRGEGISTPRVRHNGRQPLIECAKS